MLFKNLLIQVINLNLEDRQDLVLLNLTKVSLEKDLEEDLSLVHLRLLEDREVNSLLLKVKQRKPFQKRKKLL